jgi:ATP-dependent DNA ligase
VPQAVVGKCVIATFPHALAGIVETAVDDAGATPGTGICAGHGDETNVPGQIIVPAQPIERDKSPTGPGWVHEVEHDGYRLIVRDGRVLRLWTRNAVDYTNRMPAVAVKSWGFLEDVRCVIP